MLNKGGSLWYAHSLKVKEMYEELLAHPALSLRGTLRLGIGFSEYNDIIDSGIKLSEPSRGR